MADEMQPAHGPRQKWDPLPIRRELLTAEAFWAFGRLFVRIICDCATVTEIAFPELPEGEFAISCQGCDTPHWITVKGGTS